MVLLLFGLAGGCQQLLYDGKAVLLVGAPTMLDVLVKVKLQHHCCSSTPVPSFRHAGIKLGVHKPPFAACYGCAAPYQCPPLIKQVLAGHAWDGQHQGDDCADWCMQKYAAFVTVRLLYQAVAYQMQAVGESVTCCSDMVLSSAAAVDASTRLTVATSV